jgi:uncharacterized protein YPO0396
LSRHSNLQLRSVEIRDHLCSDLAIDAQDLPFVGELIQVRDDARAWEGAVARVLRNFALSLLVPTVHYSDVTAWIDGHHLGTRVVYFRVPPHPAPSRPPERRSTHTQQLLVSAVIWAESCHHGFDVPGAPPEVATLAGRCRRTWSSGALVNR